MVKTQDKMRAMRIGPAFSCFTLVLLAQGGSVANSGAISADFRHDHRLATRGIMRPSIGLFGWFFDGAG